MAYPKYEEGRYMSDVLKYDIQDYSRDTVIVASGTGKLAIGTVLGKNADNKFVPINPTADTGEQLAAAVLLENIDATATDVEDVIILSRHAIVADGGLIFPDGATDEQKSTAIGELAAVGIIARREV